MGDPCAALLRRRLGRQVRRAAASYPRRAALCVAATLAVLCRLRSGPVGCDTVWPREACWLNATPRRAVISAGLLGSFVGAAPLTGPPAWAEAPPQDVLLIVPYKSQVEKLEKVAKQSGELANMFSTQGTGGSLIGGSVDALRERMEEGKKEVLQPLLRDLQIAVPNVAPTLADADRKKLEDLPALLKGHLLELDEAVLKGYCGEYTSAKTGKLYSGGQIQRELEEVGEVVDDFLALAKGSKKAA